MRLGSRHVLTVDVPLNTMLADLDETLRTLLEDGARAARIRGRRHRVRRSGPRLVRPAVPADGEPLPLRPARGRGAAHVGVDALPAQRAHGRGPAADGHGVLLRRHGVDAGRRGRAPAALPGARDPLRLPGAARGGAQRPPRQRLAGVADQGPRSGRARARRPTSGPPSAANTRCRWTMSSGSRSIPGPTLERGPEVRTQTVRTRMLDAPGACRPVEMHRVGGRVRDTTAPRWTRCGSRSRNSGSSPSATPPALRLRPDPARPSSPARAHAPPARRSTRSSTVPGGGVDLVIDNG